MRVINETKKQNPSIPPVIIKADRFDPIPHLTQIAIEPALQIDQPSLCRMQCETKRTFLTAIDISCLLDPYNSDFMPWISTSTQRPNHIPIKCTRVSS